VIAGLYFSVNQNKAVRNAAFSYAADARRRRHDLAYSRDAGPAAAGIVGLFAISLKNFKDRAANDPAGDRRDNQRPNAGLALSFRRCDALLAGKDELTVLQTVSDFLKFVEPISIKLIGGTLGDFAIGAESAGSDSRPSAM
jgi:hypothetical protein